MAAKTGIRIKGSEQLQANIGRMGRFVVPATKRFLFTEGEKIKSLAIPLTPLDDKPLRDSAFVDKPVWTPRGFLVRLGFGGAAASYAAAQHQGPGSDVAPSSWDDYAPVTSSRSGGSVATSLNYSEPGTGPKFLEGPVIQRSMGYLDRVAKMLDKATKSAIKKRQRTLKKGV